jgi:hypothetical protein
MSERPRCACLLCRLEPKLLRELDTRTARENYSLLHLASPALAGFPEAELLLAHLRAARVDGRSDEILLELTKWQRTFQDGLVTNILLLAFLPVLHAAIRRATTRYPHLHWEDATQQAILLFLEFLPSEAFARRTSHLAFALSRRIKRRVHEWAESETVLDPPPPSLTVQPVQDNHPFEHHAFLRHFLHRASVRGSIDAADLELLIQIKIDGEPGELFCEELGITSNAFRQRVKRLLAKLRRMARARPTNARARKKEGEPTS